MQFTRNIIPGGLQDQRVIHSFGIPLILALLIGLLYRSVLDQWWMFDDTQILKHAVAFAPVDYFFSPTAWRSYVIFSLTPWLTLVYDLDLSLFGFSPKGFYAHNLLTLLACAILLYELLRPLTDRLFAGLGASLFLLGTPTAVAVEQLMVRHYLEGLLLFFLGFSCYLRSIRRQSWLWSLLSGLFFALAFSAKEIYVPMALAPLFLPLFHWRQRVLFAVPHVDRTPSLCSLAESDAWEFHGRLPPFRGYGGHARSRCPFLSVFQSARSPLGSRLRNGWTCCLGRRDRFD
ncbi:MAG: hypothetical protein EBQ73_04315 [Gammaproteobacteria bacterium]|nr:hypothetical protein [Gammaproteobacteria bacterium]